MMTIKQYIESVMSDAISRTYNTTINPNISKTSKPIFGDYQANFAMKLAGSINDNPITIANTVVKALADDSHITTSVAGPGFINISISSALLIEQLNQILACPRLGIEPTNSVRRIVVDYSNPNIAKEMHVGHLRSAVIGDSICRILTFLGHDVIRQNHIGDWGTQFGQLIEYLIDLKHLGEDTTIRDFNAFYQAAQQCFNNDPAFATRSRKRVVLLQSGDPETLELWQQLVDQSYSYFNTIYPKLDLLLTMDDIRPESYYNPMLADTVQELVALNIASYDDNAVVVKLDDIKTKSGDSMGMIIQKSDGGYLYATTDLAALKYRVKTLKADEIIYVTDHRQKLHFDMVFKTAKLAQWIDDSYPIQHVSFGAVLGTDKKPLKTRSGDLITLRQLLDEAEHKAATLLSQKSHSNDNQNIANIIGIGSLKFSDLSADKQKDYLFNWDQMLSFDGKTAPYLINAYVRIQSILRQYPKDQSPRIADDFTSPFERQLALKCTQFADVILESTEGFEIQKICQYVFELAQLFHQLYEHCPILKCSPELMNHRIALCQITAKTIKQSLHLIGIRTCDYM
ncbi:MAG: arginine--tRNA ligase [Legionellales bacterium]|nr:arginine--tRNA ligase [Legionellales bacterium]